VVWLLAAIAVEPTVRKLVQAIDPTPSGDPSIDTIRRIAYGSLSLRAMHELGDAGGLRSLSIIERSDSGGTDAHEYRRTWALSRRVLAMLLGDASLDAALSFARIRDDVPRLDDLAIGGDAIRATRSALKHARAVVCVSGLAGLGRRTLLLSAARDAGFLAIDIDARRLSTELTVLKTQMRTLARECKILQRVPLLAGIDGLTSEAIDVVGTELVAQLDGLVLVTSATSRPAIKWDRPLIAVELTKPSSSQLAKLWHAALGQGTISDGEFLAGQNPLAPALISRAADAARACAGEDGPLTPEAIASGIRTVLDDKLGQFARRMTVTQSWDDIVLPQDQIDRVVELLARVRQRQRVYETWGFAAKVCKGLGTSALFSGPPGTGKSMCAALIAKDLGLELYVVDAAKISSKWIGETEKNLAGLFDAAEASHAVLLFDEADALFGKRSDVKSSNDKHANAEVGYLLQRLESFTGICILTSNHETAIDPAFQRRLSLHLRFELPDVDERTSLWRAMLPEAAPVEGVVDFAVLARRYEMSGGYIRNAAIRAAFLAAEEDSAISLAHLDHAARVEYEGMGKIAVESLKHSTL
jgi:SpoVK/Ycf46/Vps4 family AAA+-type ATPase